jgi:WD40 repeat protein
LRYEKRIGSQLLRCGAVNAVALTPRQDTLVSVGQDKRIHFFDLRKPDPVASLPPPSGVPHGYEPLALAVARNAPIFATAGNDHCIRVWKLAEDLQRCTQLACVRAHSASVLQLCFLQDERYLASAAEDGAIAVHQITLT